MPDRRAGRLRVGHVQRCDGGGEVEIRAVAAARRPAGPAAVAVPVLLPGGPVGRGVLVPPPAPSPDADGMAPAVELTWDVAAVDGDGAVLAAWRGVVLREAGRLPRGGPWPLALLPAYLESGDPAARARPGPAHHGGGGRAGRPARRGGRVPPPRPPEPGAAGGLALTAGGAAFAACGWAPADPRHPVWPGQWGQVVTFSRLWSPYVFPTSKPTFSGSVAYRGLVPHERIPDWPVDR